MSVISYRSGRKKNHRMKPVDTLYEYTLVCQGKVKRHHLDGSEHHERYVRLTSSTSVRRQDLLKDASGKSESLVSGAVRP